MRKGLIALEVAVIISMSLMTSYVCCQDNAPKISNFALEGEKDGVLTMKVGSEKDLTFTFECDKRPDTVYIQYYGSMGPRVINNVYSSPKEVAVKITEKDGKFLVQATRSITSPRVPASCEATVWVEVAKQKSNQEKKKIDMVM